MENKLRPNAFMTAADVEERELMAKQQNAEMEREMALRTKRSEEENKRRELKKKGAEEFAAWME